MNENAITDREFALLIEGERVEAAPIGLATTIGFFFAVRILSVLLAVRFFGLDPQAGVIGSLALNYLALLAAGALALWSGRHQAAPPSLNACTRCVLLYLAVTGLSLLWSATSSVAAAAAFWLAMVADTAAVALLLRLGPTDATAEAIVRGFVRGACCVALVAWILPTQSDLRLGDEELLGPNQIGWTCGFGFFLAQYRMRKEGKSWTTSALLLGVTLLRSLSKTTIIAFLLAQAYILLRDRSMRLRTKLLLIGAAAVVTSVFASLLSSYYDVYTTAGTQSESLTGRLGIWAYMLNEALDRPWIGHGFHSVWKVVPPFYGGFEARHAHNEVLQQFYAYGLLGVAILALTYGVVARRISTFLDSPTRVFFFGLLIFVLVRGLADTEVFDLSLPMWMITMLGALGAAQRPPEVRA
jgi:hypothetical protein